jgi:hypothetical protein
MKDAYYFPHDSNAKDDPKIVLLIEQFGLEGYGIYWVLIETLRDQPGYKYPLKLIPALARRYATTAEKVEAVIRGYELFDTEDDMFFLSPSLCRRMEVIDTKRRRLSKAGRIGRQKQLQQLTGKARATPGQERKVKESKGKKNKKKYGEFSNVLLTEKEYQKLKDMFNSGADKKIDDLSYYIGSKGDKYKDHYRTILSWSRKENKGVVKTDEFGRPTA